MLYDYTINEIKTNINPGVEYEIALFYKLLQTISDESKKVLDAIKMRSDFQKVESIIGLTSINPILRELKNRGLTYYDVSFETQNDSVGPADLVLFTKDEKGTVQKIGLSVKYANTCTLNVSGRYFITDVQIEELKKLLPEYTDKYIEEMTKTYGDVSKWFRMRKPSRTTDAYIDKIRDAVISNWGNVENKVELLSALFHADSPIEFWVISYEKYGYRLKTQPDTIDENRAKDVVVKKYQTSFVAFYLDDRRIGHMQVKFNNGFVEKCKKKNYDRKVQDVEMSFGQPFGSWNFSVEK